MCSEKDKEYQRFMDSSDRLISDEIIRSCQEYAKTKYSFYIFGQGGGMIGKKYFSHKNKR